MLLLIIALAAGLIGYATRGFLGAGIALLIVALIVVLASAA